MTVPFCQVDYRGSLVPLDMCLICMCVYASSLATKVVSCISLVSMSVIQWPCLILVLRQSPIPVSVGSLSIVFFGLKNGLVRVVATRNTVRFKDHRNTCR